MKVETYHLEFITPCFCAGANQAIAEVRPASIRGKLRWWFRVVGGSKEQEAEVFGSIRGDEGNSSSLTVRVSPHPLSRQWEPFPFQGTSNRGYLLYFAKASADGSRWVKGGALPPGCRFDLQIIRRRCVSQAAAETFDLALGCFLVLGSFGLRSTRGLGSFACSEAPFSEAAFTRLLERVKQRVPGFLGGLGAFRGPENQLLDALGGQLRGLRSGGYSASKPSPLGSSRPRQTSAVHLRPVRDGDGQFRLVVFEAPPDRVLGVVSRKGAPRLGNGIPTAENPRQTQRGWR